MNEITVEFTDDDTCNNEQIELSSHDLDGDEIHPQFDNQIKPQEVEPTMNEKYSNLQTTILRATWETKGYYHYYQEILKRKLSPKNLHLKT